jgi:hypothetical protein
VVAPTQKLNQCKRTTKERKMITEADKKTVSIKNKILERFLIKGSHNAKSIGGLIASGIVSTFGVYGLTAPFFTEETRLYIALFSFVVLLIILDTIKRGAFTKFLNSLLKKIIIEKKASKIYLIIFIFSTSFMISLDLLGVFATSEMGAKLYTQSKTTNSTEFKILEQNAENGKQESQSFTTVLKVWEKTKAESYKTCNDQWKGWKTKYKAKCKKEWLEKNPMPINTANSNIKISDFKAIEESKKGFLDKWLQTILFVILGLLTLLMQYLTIAKIYDDFEEIEESLTTERISFINDTIQEHFSILAEYEQAQAEMLADSERAKKTEELKFQEVGEAIAITHKKKMVQTRGKTVKRIANNKYVPQEESKSAFVRGGRGKKTFNKERITFKLFLNGTAKKGDKLTSKGELVNVKDRGENQKMVDLYKELEKQNLLEFKTGLGYISLVDFQDFTSQD